ncbi:MAG: AI-2E family transporter [Acidobacteriota bacterium]|nr:AI-2E family transporter [Acidobacteriota bacterium]MDQ7087840.1 AI-2E family transporter [Acidobacteriota bacterium]
METSQRQSGAGLRVLLTLAGVVVVVAGLKAAATLLQPLLVSVFLAVLSLPLLNWLQSRRVPRALAVMLTFLSVLLVLTGMVTLVGGSVTGFSEAAPRYQQRLQVIVDSLTTWLQARGIEIPREVTTEMINPGIVIKMAGDLFRIATSLLSKTVLILLLMVFILFEAAVLPGKLRAAFGNGREEHGWYSRIRVEIQRYLVIKTIISMATGVIVGLSLWLLGIDFPLLWGLLAFMLNYIPQLGSVLAALPTVLLAVVQYGVGRAIAVAVIYTVVNMLLGNVVEPYFMGRRLGLSTLVVFLSMVFWGWVWGPLGMLLSVPLTMIVKIALENSGDFRWAGVLLDAQPPDAS